LKLSGTDYSVRRISNARGKDSFAKKFYVSRRKASKAGVFHLDLIRSKDSMGDSHEKK